MATTGVNQATVSGGSAAIAQTASDPDDHIAAAWAAFRLCGYTPANNSTNLTGAVAVTGWALSPLATIASVGIYREPIPGEVPQGERTGVPQQDRQFLHRSLRPDLASAYPTLSQQHGGLGLST